MGMMKITNVTLITIAAALLVIAIGSINNDRVAAADVPSIAAQDATAIDGQAQPAEETSSNDSQRVNVQLWTLLAAGSAAALGLVLLGVRITLGWVKPPPEQEEVHH